MLSANEPSQEPPEVPPLPPGTSLGNHVLHDRIGYGAMGAVHRDLKPSNIFVARDNDGVLTAKVLAFGAGLPVKSHRLELSADPP